MDATPGIYKNIEFGEYELANAANWSLIKHHARCPAYVKSLMESDRNEYSKALEMGAAVHMAVFEPQRFEREYECGPDARRNSNAWKDAEASANERCVTMLKPGEHADALNWRDAVHTHTMASRFLCADGYRELSIVWRDQTTGMLCKGRIDLLAKLDGRWWVVDLKTSSKPVGWDSFSRTIAQYDYHGQAAFYIDGAAAALGEPIAGFVFIAVETTFPHLVATYPLDPEAIAEGRRLYQRCLKSHQAGVERGEWPGYELDGEPITLPAWAMSDSPDIVLTIGGSDVSV